MTSLFSTSAWGMWVACEAAKSCFIYRDLPEMRSLLTEAQGWATGSTSDGRLRQLVDESGIVQGQLPFEYAVLNVGPQCITIAEGGDDVWQASEAKSAARMLMTDANAENSTSDEERNLSRARLRDPIYRARAEAKVAARIASALLRFPR